MPEKQAVSVKVAEAVKARIIAGADSLTEREYTVRRSYLEWDLDLKGMEHATLSDAEMLLIDVVAHEADVATELAARGSMKFVVPVDIAIRRKFGENEIDKTTGRVKLQEIDRYVLLTQEIGVMFSKYMLTDFEFAVWDNTSDGMKIMANPLRDHLREMKQFTGIVRVWLRADVSFGS